MTIGELKGILKRVSDNDLEVVFRGAGDSSRVFRRVENDYCEYWKCNLSRGSKIRKMIVFNEEGG